MYPDPVKFVDFFQLGSGSGTFQKIYSISGFFMKESRSGFFFHEIVFRSGFIRLLFLDQDFSGDWIQILGFQVIVSRSGISEDFFQFRVFQAIVSRSGCFRRLDIDPGVSGDWIQIRVFQKIESRSGGFQEIGSRFGYFRRFYPDPGVFNQIESKTGVFQEIVSRFGVFRRLYPDPFFPNI